MPKKDTAAFLQWMNERNNRIAAQEPEVSAPKEDVDPVRIQRDVERRERLGQLRARVHPRKHTQTVYPVFGHVDLRE